jgi:hypothetical protein
MPSHTIKRSPYSTRHSPSPSPKSHPNPHPTPIKQEQPPTNQSSSWIWGLFGYTIATHTISHQKPHTHHIEQEASCSELLANYQKLINTADLNQLNLLKAQLTDKCPHESQSLNA